MTRKTKTRHRLPDEIREATNEAYSAGVRDGLDLALKTIKRVRRTKNQARWMSKLLKTRLTAGSSRNNPQTKTQRSLRVGQYS